MLAGANAWRDRKASPMIKTPGSAQAFHFLFRVLEGGMNIGAGLFGLVAPQDFLPSMFPALAQGALLQDPMVLALGRQIAAMFLLIGLTLWFLLRRPSPWLVRTMLACLLPSDVIAIGLFVHCASQVGWDATTAFNAGFGLFLLLARLPYIRRPELATSR